ncbi:MAG: type I-E CRISPR-associated protein Cse2/CasB [Deltaproteobacteria bacterium]|nr:type I-E CRISPR-associated protein Cse2/CasB [Deltaproteobacteria bacterium]
MTKFTKFLEELKTDRAALAKLRRGLGKTSRNVEIPVDMFPYVVPFLPKKREMQQIYFLIASLFGFHWETTDDSNWTMGKVFRRLPENDTREKRFKALLSAEGEALHYHLRQAISLAKSKEVPINYGLLLRHLYGWSHPDRWVQLRWAKDFWVPEEVEGS